jgi:hypothetical protein
MAFDLLIKNGTIVDGTGADRFHGDIAVTDGKIVEVGKVSGSASRTIDASDSASFASSDSSVCIVCIHLPRRGLLTSAECLALAVALHMRPRGAGRS